ncbi:hypothetical protein WDW86_18390 [Bdellovibrionota bacterium FG-2]
MKSAVVALVVDYENDSPRLLEIISDDREISVLETACGEGNPDPLQKLEQKRQKVAIEEEEFANYVEELLSQPFLRPEIQDHGVQWLKSKAKIEQYQKNEAEAAKIIADYAFKVFVEDPSKKDFFLVGPSTQVRIRVFSLREKSVQAA